VPIFFLTQIDLLLAGVAVAMAVMGKANTRHFRWFSPKEAILPQTELK